MTEESLKHYRLSRKDLKGKTKTFICSICKEEEVASIFSSKNYICRKCKEELKNQDRYIATHICKNCRKEFNYDYRKYRKKEPDFCSEYCAKAYANKQLTGLTKEAFCKQCGKKILVDIRSSVNNVLCKDCKESAHKVVYNFKEDSEVGKFERKQMYKQKSINLQKVGFDFNAPLDTEYFRVKAYLNKLYNTDELSTLVIQNMFNISSTRTVPDLLHAFNIETRTFKDANHLAIKKGRNNPLNSLDSIRTFYKHGWYKDFLGNKHYLRSSLEFKLAERLDSLKIEYETESEIEYIDRRDNKIHHGYPDFYLPSYNLYIETKGEFFYNKENLEDRFRAIDKNNKKFLVLTYHNSDLSKINNFSNLDEGIVKLFI